MNKAQKLIKFIEELINGPDNEKLDNDDRQLTTEAKNNISELNDVHKIRASKNAIEHYNGESKHINEPLRTGRSPSLMRPKVLEHLENLSNITAKPTQHTFHVYRGSTDIDYSNLKKDDLIHDKGFVSTSLTPGTANNFAHDHHEGNLNNPHLFRIHVTPGTKGHYISAHDDSLENIGEHEFLIHKNTHFRVGDTHEINIDGGKNHPITDLHIHSQED